MGAPGPPDAGNRLVATAAQGSVFAAAVGSDVVLRSLPAGERLVPWIRTSSPIAALATADGILVVVSRQGGVVGLAPNDGSEVFATSAGVDAADVAADSGGIWVLSGDRRSLTHVDPAGHVDDRHRVITVDRLTAAGEGVWYTALDDSLLRYVTRDAAAVANADLGVVATGRGALAVCRYAVWVSVADGLVSTPQRGRRDIRHLPVDKGSPVENLACVRDAALIGGDRLDGMFVLDIGADDSVRDLPTDRAGLIDALVTDGGSSWAVTSSEDGPVAVRLTGQDDAGSE